MARVLYFVLLVVVVWTAHADQDDENEDFIPDETQNNREIKCGRYYAQYPNPEDCGSYIVCQNGRKTIKSCPSGQHYNFKTIRCVEPCEAFCNKTLSCECKWSTCGLDDVCFLEQIVGGCRNRVPRYFFNKRTGHCERFGYSGCMGNENNFETLEECQQKCSKAKPIPDFNCPMMDGSFPNPDNCSTYFQCSDGEPQLMSCESGLHFNDESGTCEKPCDANCDKSLSCKCKWPTCGLDDLCFLPSDTGPCRALFHNYYFNRRTGQCEEFQYGGCDGNKNNFRQKEECERVCSKKRPIPSFICLSMNGRFPNPDNCRTYFQCSGGKPQLMSCESGLHYSDKSKTCEKPCDAYCDKSLSCKCKWPTCGLKDLCFMPPEVGPCRAGFYNYYFNRRTGQCEEFLYGGCRGNENNFQKKEDCEKTCTKSEEPPVEESTGSTLEVSTEPTLEESTEQTLDEFTESSLEESTEQTSEEFTEPSVDEIPDLPAEEAIDTSFECRQDGLYPHPKSCRSFVKCSKGVPTLNACPVKLHFNNKTKACETPCKANCDRTYACKCKWPTCGTNALCFLPAKPGPCKGNFKRFHFNKRSGECTTFEYGGCLGNENNFLTKHACERKCKHSLDICKLPKKTGPCHGNFERYYFNHKEEKCQKFIYGGCRGNHNNYKTLEECETTCLQKKLQEIYPLLGCSQENSNWTNVDDCSTYYKCSGGQTHLVKCPSGQHYNLALKRCTAPCDAFCEPSIACKCGWPTCKKSEDFTCVRDGLFRDPESCSSYIHCVNGQKYDMPCPSGYHFNEGNKLCEKPSKGQCQERKEDISSEPMCTEDGVRPDFESCGRYIQCSSGQKQIVSCPPGLHFNEASKQCDSPCDARCDMRLAMPCGWPMGGENTDDTECTEDGMFMDLSSCSRYVHCSNGRKSLKSCPPGLHFNEKTKQCDSPCDARCDLSLAFECGWPMGADCPLHEHYDKYFGACQDNCTTYNKGYGCPLVFKSGCVCDEGYVRGPNEKCILISECKNYEEQGPKRAAYQRNCKNYKDWIVPSPFIWLPGCVCDKGYVRNSGGKCIPTDECETDN